MFDGVSESLTQNVQNSGLTTIQLEQYLVVIAIAICVYEERLPNAAASVSIQVRARLLYLCTNRERGHPRRVQQPGGTNQLNTFFLWHS